ncbi:MAG: hypothetical protein H0X33_04780 [Taibaiella sp.]|nr:hypothetical protein [Taibaiella sp.]
MENLNKVAKITLYFWIMKVLATTLGETLGDLFSMTMNIGYLISLIIAMVFFLIVLFIQLKVSRFYAALYWLVIVGTTTVGTEISDFIDRTLHLGYAIGSSILFGLLLLVLYIWHIQEKKIVVYPVTRVKVEVLYWIAILFSNSLGTAFGDFLSDNLGLSYLYGAMVTAGVILIVVALHYFTRINAVLLFWIAFVFTRPFGATFGDFLTKPIVKGGLNLGTLQSSMVAAALLSILIFISVRVERGKQPELETSSGGATLK